MQISRRILVACVTTTILFPIFLKGEDTPAQIKARQAMEQQMRQMGTAPATPAPAAPAPKPAPAVKPAPAAPAVAAPQAKPALPITPIATDSEAQIKARQALDQKMREMGTLPPAAAPATAATPKSTPAVKPAPVMPAAKPTPAPIVAAPQTKPALTISPTPEDTEAQIKAREALNQKMNELGTMPAPAVTATRPSPAPATSAKPATPAVRFEDVPQASTAGPTDEKALQALRQKMDELKPQPEATTPKLKHQPENAVTTTAPKKPEAKKKPEPQKPVANAKNPTEFPVMKGPPTGLSADKEQRLQQLLEDYRADKVSPDQYQTERAKILAGP